MGLRLPLAIGLVCAVAAVVCAMAMTTPTALAGSCGAGNQYCAFGQYGEVWRGGGFDNSRYANGTYTGSLTPGKFVDPVGFAVDTKDTTPGGDGTAIYVLDRTSNLPSNVTGTTSWRLQKLSDTGQVLGTDEFTLPADGNYYEMLGLAVDPATGRVYALVVSYDQNPNGVDACNNSALGSPCEIADEILAWSTTPDGSAHLTGASGLSTDTLTRGAAGYPTPAVLSTQEQLIPLRGSPQGEGALITYPEGLAVDVTGSTDYLAVQSYDDNGPDIVNGNQGYSGIAQVCAISSCGTAASGTVTKQWSANVLATLRNDSGDEDLLPAGISTAPDGSLTILLDEGSGPASSNFDVVNVPADLTSRPAILSSGLDVVLNRDGTTDLDNAAVVTSDLDPESASGDPDGATAATFAASPQIVALSNGLYAGEFQPDSATRADPENPNGTLGPWTQNNPAVRVLAPLSDQDPPLGDGDLSSPTPPLSNLYETLGNQTINASGVTDAASACNLSDPISADATNNTTGPMPSLAAGANGTIWVLTRGADSSTAIAGNPPGGRELIELSPGHGTPCPAPSGTFTVATGGGAPQPASQSNPLLVSEGSAVQFNACPPPTTTYPACPPTGPVGINYLGGATSEYAWNFGDGSAPVQAFAGSTWPSGVVSHTYNVAGDYTVSLEVFGDYGEYDETGQIHVLSGSVPIGAFTASAAGPLTMSFDASNSTPSDGASILDYHWQFGDGQIDDTATPVDTHTYAAAGTYNVTLSVLDSVYGHSAPVTETVTVLAPPPPPPAPPPTPTTPPVPLPGPPAVQVRSTSRTAEHGRESLVLLCPTGQVSCAGTVELKTAKPVVAHAAAKKGKQGKQGKAGKKTREHKHVLFLGSAKFTIAGGRSKSISIRLSANALALLSDRRNLSVIAQMTATNPGGLKDVTHYTLTVRLAKEHRSHHRADRKRTRHSLEAPDTDRSLAPLARSRETRFAYLATA